MDNKKEYRIRSLFWLSVTIGCICMVGLGLYVSLTDPNQKGAGLILATLFGAASLYSIDVIGRVYTLENSTLSVKYFLFRRKSSIYLPDVVEASEITPKSTGRAAAYSGATEFILKSKSGASFKVYKLGDQMHELVSEIEKAVPISVRR